METAQTNGTNGTHHPVTGEVLPMQSATIANLAAALAEAQGEFHAASKDRTAKVNPKEGVPYSYTYANFASIMEAVRPALAKNKLAITCRVRTNATEATATAILMHASGEWFCGEPVSIPVADRRPQTVGISMEYARKYAVRSLLGIATDEADEPDTEDVSHRNGHATAARTAPPPSTTSAVPRTTAEVQSKLDQLLDTNRPDEPLVAIGKRKGQPLANEKDPNDLRKAVDWMHANGGTAKFALAIGNYERRIQELENR